MYIQNVKIKNFRGFQDFNKGAGINLLYPDTDQNSIGLNILIGENNSGKTNFIDVLSRLNSKKRKFVVEDWNVKCRADDISIEVLSSKKEVQRMRGAEQQSRVHVEGNFFESKIEIIKDQRVWTAKYNFDGSLEHEKYLSSSNVDRNAIDNELSQLLASIEEQENKQNFTDIFKKVFDDFSDWGKKSYAKGGDVISYKLSNGEYFDIDMSLGSGILNLFRIVTAIYFDKKVVVIDEPEAFLHPSAQIKLSKLLIEESRNRQIIISTHSPYMYLFPVRRGARLVQFKNDSGNGISAQDIGSIGWGLFGDESPTWGEINYYVYNLYTVEFHNELYGFIKSQAYQAGHLNGITFDDWLLQELKKEDKQATKRDWYEIENGQKTQYLKQVTNPTYIRHTIHHPENSHNPTFEDQEFQRSTDFLVKIAHQFK